MSQGLCPDCGAAVNLTAIKSFILCLLVAMVAGCEKPASKLSVLDGVTYVGDAAPRKVMGVSMIGRYKLKFSKGADGEMKCSLALTIHDGLRGWGQPEVTELKGLTFETNQGLNHDEVVIIRADKCTALAPGSIVSGQVPDSLTMFNENSDEIKLTKSGSPAKNDQANVVSRTPTNTVTTLAAEPALPKEISISRAAFEARYGKPLFTEDEFDAVFKGLYGIGLDQFLAMLGTNYFGVLPERRDALAEALRIFGNKSDSFRESYTAIVPHLLPGKEILDNLDKNLSDLGIRTEGRGVTKFEKLTGLSKSEYLASIEKLGRWQQSGAFTIENFARHLEDGGVDVDRFGEAEPFEGFRWRDIDRCLMSIRPVPDRSSTSVGSGLLGQLWYVRRIIPCLDFAVYRGNGVDSLVFYDKDGVALCIQTLWGSEGGFIVQLIPKHINIRSLLGPKDYEKMACWLLTPGGRGRLVMDIVPVHGIWSPLVYETTRGRVSNVDDSTQRLLYMPKPVEGTEAIQFEDKPVDVSSNPKVGALMGQEYVSQFTNTFAFFNHEPAIAIQQNVAGEEAEAKDFGRETCSRNCGLAGGRSGL